MINLMEMHKKVNESEEIIITPGLSTISSSKKIPGSRLFQIRIMSQ